MKPTRRRYNRFFRTSARISYVKPTNPNVQQPRSLPSFPGDAREEAMDYSFLVETYGSERLKTLNVWAMFHDDDLNVRPHPRLARDRTPREHMVHQCMSEDK